MGREIEDVVVIEVRSGGVLGKFREFLGKEVGVYFLRFLKFFDFLRYRRLLYRRLVFRVVFRVGF